MLRSNPIRQFPTTLHPRKGWNGAAGQGVTGASAEDLEFKIDLPTSSSLVQKPGSVVPNGRSLALAARRTKNSEPEARTA